MAHELVCRVTNDLPRELASIDGGKWSQGSTGLSFPGILMTSQSRLCAAIGFHVDAGAVLSIAEPIVCCPDTPETHSRWMIRLFEEVLAESTRRNCGSVRAIEPVASHRDLAWLRLKDTGFSIRATICQWTKRVSNDSGPAIRPIGLQHGMAEPVIRYVRCSLLTEDSLLRQRIKLLLRQVLSDATDLVTLPSPDPDELLEDWIRQAATLVLAEEDDALIGLCCVVAEEFDAAESLIDEIQIQYIGVVPECRNRQIASHLISSLPAAFSGEAPNVELMFASIAAFCDNLNTPAKRLYAANGFEQRGEFNVWCCNVETTDPRQILSGEVPEL